MIPISTTETTPLYQQICGAITKDGTLDPKFTLLRPVGEENGMQLNFADGAYDGISLYHMAPDKRDLKSLTEILGLICVGKYDKASECLALYFSSDPYISMLALVEDFQSWIFEHHSALDPNRMMEFAVETLKNTADVESAKFALTLLALFNVEKKPAVANLVRIFALADEFTLYCLFIFRNWEKAAEEIFACAQKVSGWGRIHAVEYLHPTTDAMGRWLLLEGWRNNVSAEYSVLPVIEKAALLEHLQANDLDEAAFSAALELTAVLFMEGPCEGLSGLSDPKGYMDAFFAAAAQRSLSDKEAEALAAVRKSYADYEKQA